MARDRLIGAFRVGWLSNVTRHVALESVHFLGHGTHQLRHRACAGRTQQTTAKLTRAADRNPSSTRAGGYASRRGRFTAAAHRDLSARKFAARRLAKRHDAPHGRVGRTRSATRPTLLRQQLFTSGDVRTALRRSPLVYHTTLDAHTPPQACETLRRAGYECSYLSSGTIQWMRMNEYIRPDTFAHISTDERPDWVRGDREMLAQVRERLAAAKQPQFIVCFLMSTHFPYLYSDEFATHTRWCRPRMCAARPSSVEPKSPTAIATRRRFLIMRWRDHRHTRPGQALDRCRRRSRRVALRRRHLVALGQTVRDAMSHATRDRGARRDADATARSDDARRFAAHFAACLDRKPSAASQHTWPRFAGRAGRRPRVDRHDDATASAGTKAVLGCDAAGR